MDRGSLLPTPRDIRRVPRCGASESEGSCENQGGFSREVTLIWVLEDGRGLNIVRRRGGGEGVSREEGGVCFSEKSKKMLK